MQNLAPGKIDCNEHTSDKPKYNLALALSNIYLMGPEQNADVVSRGSR
jgi:hypothetical protein